MANGDPYGVVAGSYGGLPQSRERSILRSGPLGKPKGYINIWEMILLPWLCLVLVLTCFLLAGSSDQIAIMFFVPLVLLGLSGAFTYSRYQQGRNGEVVLGLLCIVAIILGVAVGGYAHATILAEYWRLGRGASYANVLPTELAAGKNDATTLEFTEGTRVDTVKTYGFVDGRSNSGTIYCVAPISTGDPAETRIQFWAAGTECCFPRENFDCGEVSDAEARGAVVWPKSYSEKAGFQNAIQGAEKTYNVQAGDDYLLVKWVKDPVDWRNSLWNHTMVLFWVFSGVYLLLSAMIGCALFPQLKQN